MDEKFIISDANLGDIEIDKETGKISNKELYYHEHVMFNDFPVEINMDEYEIMDINDCDLESSKDAFSKALNLIISRREEIQNTIIDFVFNWFKDGDYTIDDMNEKFFSLDITVTTKIDSEENIEFVSSWYFNDQTDDNAGFAECYYDKETNKIKNHDIGFY
ncbi:MAG: hypothetical protein MJ244_01065 [Clostridia bacterium]|nr:hypothetical protein [Clostridia bacterium]